jgi:hypothetical protein
MSRLNNLLTGIPNLEIPPPTQEEKFHLFPDLPLELRNKIWQLAANEPRIIILDDRQRPPSNRYSWSSTVPQQQRHPGILHTSKEARAEGMRHYELCWEKTKGSSNAQHRRGIHWWANAVFVNFHVDVFHLKSPKWLENPSGLAGLLDNYNFESDVIHRIQHFALIYSTMAYYRCWSPSNKAASIRSFTVIFPAGFTPGATVEGDLFREDTRNHVVRALGRESFQLLFKWEVEDGFDDFVPCRPGVVAATRRGGWRQKLWWMS